MMRVEGEVGTQQTEAFAQPEPVAEPVEAKPRRRIARPRAEAAAADAASSVESSDVSASIDADRLPPSLSGGEESAERPRRRRRVRGDDELVPPAA